MVIHQFEQYIVRELSRGSENGRPKSAFWRGRSTHAESGNVEECCVQGFLKDVGRRAWFLVFIALALVCRFKLTAENPTREYIADGSRFSISLPIDGDPG